MDIVVLIPRVAIEEIGRRITERISEVNLGRIPGMIFEIVDVEIIGGFEQWTKN